MPNIRVNIQCFFMSDTVFDIFYLESYTMTLHKKIAKWIHVTPFVEMFPYHIGKFALFFSSLV